MIVDGELHALDEEYAYCIFKISMISNEYVLSEIKNKLVDKFVLYTYQFNKEKSLELMKTGILLPNDDLFTLIFKPPYDPLGMTCHYSIKFKRVSNDNLFIE